MTNTTGKPDIKTTAGKLEDFRQKMSKAEFPMGREAAERVHERGKLTARERINLLLDPGSFVETDALAMHHNWSFGMGSKRPYGDGVITGYGTIDGRGVVIFSQDPTVFGGSLGEVGGEKILKIMDLAISTGRPIIAINDGGGARIQEGVASLAQYGEMFKRNIKASGVVPQISILMGATAGGGVYSPALTDFVIMVEDMAKMFVTGPDVIKTVTGEIVSMEDLGGSETHMTKSGVAHYVAQGELDAFNYVRELLTFIPDSNQAKPPSPRTLPQPLRSIEDELTPGDLELDSIIPDQSHLPYDMYEVIKRISDDEYFLEIQGGRAQNIITAFARIGGHSVLIVANQPQHLAGTLNIDASEKAARIIRFADAFGIPIVTLVDVPGYLPGTQQEHDGIIRRGAKLLYAYGEATVGKITVITRKAYGGAYLVMGCKHMGADINLAWPTAEIAVMGASGAVEILYRKELAAVQERGEDVGQARYQFERDYENMLYNPYVAAEKGYIDAVIPPSHTRGQIIRALNALHRKIALAPVRKHGNIPL